MRTTIVLADDHPIVRQGLKLLLEREGFEVVGEAADGLDAIELAKRLHPDVIVLDIVMPNLNGVACIGEIRKISPHTKIVLLTMHAEEHQVLEALRAGAKGCVLKSQASEHLLHALREVLNGGVYLSPSVSGAMVHAYVEKNGFPYDPLSNRERQVLQLVAEGKTTKEVAVILGVAVKTAESHRTRLMEKLDIHSVAGLVRYAVRHGVIQA
jgi:DNA-binding NarL/FixJ family response regulator